MFPRLPVRATFVADTNFVSKTQEMFLIFVRNILYPEQMFPRLRGTDTKQMFCVPIVCPPKKHHEQQCVRNNVSSFATTYSYGVLVSHAIIVGKNRTVKITLISSREITI